MRLALARLGQGLSWLLVGVVVLALGATVLVPLVAGAQSYTVLTGSMAPSLPPGTVVVVRPVPVGDIAVGSVITYQLRSGSPTVVTHRVVSQGVRTDGTPVLRTKGDANAVEDAAPVQPVQVRGELWYAVPWVGRVGHLLPARQQAQLKLLAAIGLFGYAAWLLGGAVRDRRREAGAAR